jgi:UDP-N-acetylmuramate dehydrogenase
MMPAARHDRLIDRLPAVRGEYVEGASLADFTWFRVGGPAEVLFRPRDEADLLEFMRGRPGDVPLTVIGVGANLLVRDGGVPGVTIRLGRGLAGVETDGVTVRAGAAAANANVALACRDAGIAGLEFLRGIPGTIGGGIRMNAGAYGREFKDILVQARAIDGAGNIHEVTVGDLGMSYRHSDAPADWIFVSGIFRGTAGEPADIAARMADISAVREDSQPVKSRTGGSTFKNPDGAKAWELIDRAGCRGLMRGGAQVSPQHCNFLINTGNATAADLEGLGEEVRRRVRDTAGIELEWEIRRIGRHLDSMQEVPS